MWGGGGQYDAWATFLDHWGSGAVLDPAGLPALAQEDFAADGWERLTNRLTTALSQRLTGWAKALARAIEESRDEFEVGRALAHARTGLAAVRELAAHPGLPPDLAERLVEMVDMRIRAAQDALEAQVDRMRQAGVDRRAVEARLRTIRDNLLTVGPHDLAGAAPTGWLIDVTVPGRRRVITPPK